jgi:O-acetyl-ADP-ribose deacetylase (regulator of RNase III)
MITVCEGNIFTIEVDALVNPVNCVGVMGAGLALQFKERWPYYFNNYRWRCQQKMVQLRNVYAFNDVWPSGRPVTLISFPTKSHWKDKSNLDDIGFGLSALGDFLKRAPNIKSVSIPALGCGLGGLGWEDVEHIVNSMLLCYIPDVDIRLFKPQ